MKQVQEEHLCRDIHKIALALEKIAKTLPSIQPDSIRVIRCKECKHWKHKFKTANSNGLGSCDFHNVALVTSEGFCYWAEKRGELDE